MLTQIVVASENAFDVPILGVTPKDILLIRQITGLNPPDINLFIGDYSRDGGIYQGRRVGTRNVVITFDLNPNPALGQTIAGLRDMLYKAFNDPQVDADYIKLELHDDLGRVLYVVGYTEKFETEVFSVDSMCQISIICPDPFIRDNVETVLSHESGWISVPFTYGGTAETGFKVEITLTGNSSVLTLDNNGKTMVLTYPFLTGDVVNIDTVRGERSIVLTRSGVDTPLIAKLSAVSPWLELHSQSNTLQVYGPTTANLIAVINTLTYRAAYWGV